MKTICNYAFKGLCLYILIIVVVLSTSIEVVTYKSDSKVTYANIGKQLQSSFIAKIVEKEEDKANLEIKNSIKDNIKEVISTIDETKKKEEEKNNPEPAPAPVQSAPQPEPQPEKPKSTYQYVTPLDTSGMQGIYIDTGAITHYGHDCCSGGKTATGYDISDGRIYYTDPTFGSVRIVAAGKNEFRYGTILRLNGYSQEPIIAIVLDVGGISLKKDYKLDLLVESEAVASRLGVKRNVSIEVLREGY